MKIRNGFVSNSSSASFTVPSFFLTDEQKEMILSLDDSKEDRKAIKEFFGDTTPDINDGKYPRNEEFHKIFQEMEENDQWWDSWGISESPQEGYIAGGTMMDNGSLKVLMEKIGIDVTAVEFTNDGHSAVYMATHPEAMKFFAGLINKQIEEFKKKSEKDQEEARDFHFAPPEINPYEAKDEDFKTDWSDPYIELDQNTFIKRIEK